MKMIAITSCPTGIAHTYMAAEALEEAAKAAGHEMVVETQGSAGSDDFPPGAVEAADVIIIAADVDVKGRERFTNMPQVNIGVKKAIDDPAGVVAEAERAVMPAKFLLSTKTCAAMTRLLSRQTASVDA